MSFIGCLYSKAGGTTGQLNSGLELASKQNKLQASLGAQIDSLSNVDIAAMFKTVLEQMSRDLGRLRDEVAAKRQANLQQLCGEVKASCAVQVAELRQHVKSQLQHTACERGIRAWAHQELAARVDGMGNQAEAELGKLRNGMTTEIKLCIEKLKTGLQDHFNKADRVIFLGNSRHDQALNELRSWVKELVGNSKKLGVEVKGL